MYSCCKYCPFIESSSLRVSQFNWTFYGMLLNTFLHIYTLYTFFYFALTHLINLISLSNWPRLGWCVFDIYFPRRWHLLMLITLWKNGPIKYHRWLDSNLARGNCVQRAREARLLTRQLDASGMTDDSLNVEAQTGTDAWLHSHTAGVLRNVSKGMRHFGIDQILARRTDQSAQIADTLPAIKAEPRLPMLHFIRILHTVSPQCISSANSLQSCEIWLWGETRTALITQQDVLIIWLGDCLEAQSPSETFDDHCVAKSA